MMGSGGMIVMDEDNCMVNIAKFFLEFTVDESCGKCPPCRIGTRRMLEMLTRITEGKGEPGDIEKLETLAKNIKASALCGLGRQPPTRCFPPSGTSGTSTRPIFMKALPRRGVQGPAQLYHRPGKVQGLHHVRPPVPRRRHQRQGAGGSHHRQQQVRQVRRLYGGVQIRRHQPEIIPSLANTAECRRLLWAPAPFYARWIKAGGIGRNRDIRYSPRYSRRRISLLRLRIITAIAQARAANTRPPTNRLAQFCTKNDNTAMRKSLLEYNMGRAS